MTGQVSFKVSGPWRMLVRQDNQPARVINANEDYSVILNEGAQTANITISMMSTDMPYQLQAGPADETKAFAPDPHEPEKTAEQREMAFDPLEREREMRERDAQNRPVPGDGSPAAIQVQQGAKDIAQASGVPIWEQPEAGTDLDEAEAEKLAAEKANEEASRKAAAQEAEAEERKRATAQKARDEEESAKSKTTSTAKKK